MAAPAKEKESSALARGKADIFFAQFLHGQKLLQVRNAACLILFIGACALWLATLGRLEVGKEGLPWYCAILVFGIASVRFLKLDSGFAQIVGVPKSKEPIKLRESLSVCYLIAAIGLYGSAVYSLLHPYKTPKLMQIVDIQLLSPQDYENNHSILPGSKPEEALRKRVADTVSQMGSLNQPKVAPAVQKNKKEDLHTPHPDVKVMNSNGKADLKHEDEKPSPIVKAPAQQERQLEQSTASPLMIPTGWKTKVIDPQFVSVAARSASASKSESENQPYISEVSPPELVELVENDGDLDAVHVFQKGGKSSGGKGADNELSNYLKELHKLIKNSWNPPSGNTSSVQLLFRLKKDGHLAFIRVSRSSGDKQLDESAIKAVTVVSTKGLPLPHEYAPKYLDVSYNFKYNVDELKEVPTPQAQ
jgi:TonB family protein